MQTTEPSHDHMEEENHPHDSESVWPMIIAAVSTFGLGYFLGRATFNLDVQKAILKVQESGEPGQATVRVL